MILEERLLLSVSHEKKHEAMTTAPPAERQQKPDEYNQKHEQYDARTWSRLHDAQMEAEVTKSDLEKKSQETE